MDATTPESGRMGGPEPEEAHGASVPKPDHHVNYVAVFGTLIVLTVITVAVAYIGFKHEWQKIVVALAIASIKAVAVAGFFMHLKFEGKLIYLILFVPVFLCIVLVLGLIPDVVHSPLFNSVTPDKGAMDQ